MRQRVSVHSTAVPFDTEIQHQRGIRDSSGRLTLPAPLAHGMPAPSDPILIEEQHPAEQTIS